MITIQAPECPGNNSVSGWESATSEKPSKPKIEDLAKIARFADMLTAMGTEPRLRIVQLLLTAHPEGLVVGDIQSNLEIAPSTLSHHIKTLMVVGLIGQVRDGTTLVCHANYDVMRELVDFLVAECCSESAESGDAKSAA